MDDSERLKSRKRKSMRLRTAKPLVVRRKMKTSSISLHDMNDDELTEIFLRLPVETLHRFKCVCKRWLSLISNSYFIRHYIECRSTAPSKFALLLHSYSNRKKPFRHLIISEGDSMGFSTEKYDLTLSFLPVMQKSYRLAVQRNEVSYDLRTQQFNYKYFDSIQVLKISSGFILCEVRLMPFPEIFLYFLCNPLTKQWLELPRITFRSSSSCQTGILYHPNADALDKVIVTVVMIEDNYSNGGTNVFRTWIFSSLNDNWEEATVALPSGWQQLSWTHYTTDVCVYNQKLLWYAGKCIVSYDPINYPYKCDIIEIPTVVVDRVLRFQQLFVSSKGEFQLCCDITNDEHCLWKWDYVNDDNTLPRLIEKVLFPRRSDHMSIFIFPDDILYVIRYSGTREEISLHDIEGNRLFELPKNGKVSKIWKVYPFIMASWSTSIIS